MKKYMWVIYARNGGAIVSRPFDSADECDAELKKEVRNHFDKVIATTRITREMDEKDGIMKVFGHPRSHDLMQDRKFIKEVMA